MYERYHSEIIKFERDGFARRIPKDECSTATTCDDSYHMPHHAVVTTGEPGEKWRIVFDCSAAERDVKSLNQYLLPGENLNPDLVTLLMNFRLRSVAVSCDITKAYMMIRVQESDQRYFRFLWRGPEDDAITTFQMQRVTWGATPSAFLLAATIRHHLRKENAAETLANSLYADDALASFDSEQEALELTDVARRVLESAGMQLAKWESSSRRVLTHLSETGVRHDQFDPAPSDVLKVLGISWDSVSDKLRFIAPKQLNIIDPNRPMSKRRVLQIIASVFVPMGLLAAYTLRGKLILKKLWAEPLEWNQVVPPDIKRAVVQYASEFNGLEDLRLSRRYSERDEKPVAHFLHMFGDASPMAFAACAYIEKAYRDGSCEVSLVMSKARLAPKEKQTLPRLELLAAVIAVRLKNFLVDRLNVKFDRVFFYTDSKIVYHWATGASPGSWKVFVSNRVDFYTEALATGGLVSRPGAENVADLATRGTTARTLADSLGWWTGPQWIRLPMEHRPISRPRTDDAVCGSVRHEAHALIAATVGKPEPALLDLERFNTAGRASRVMALVMRFVLNARRKETPGPRQLYGVPEGHLIRQEQQKYFPREIAAVTQNERVSTSSKLAAFKLFIDAAGVLRAQTRLTRRNLFTYEEANPVVLPGESRLARLLIVDTHRIDAHFGIGTVMTCLRKRFWITRGRQIVKAMLSRCVICKRKQGRPAGQIEAPLPIDRATLRNPFSVAGVDMCGHFYTRSRDGANRAGEYVTHKSYVAVFTCAATRAVHLEVVQSLSAAQTCLALRRFLATYTACEALISDNGKNFARASTDIKRLLNTAKDKEVRELLQGRGLNWSFGCPQAPHRNGFFERAVGMLKTALFRSLGKSLLGYEEFRTVLIEMAAVINSRPLTSVPSELGEPVAITPADFLRGGAQPAPLATLLPVDSLQTDEPDAAQLRERFRERTTYFRSLSVRWWREVLKLLRIANQTRGHNADPIAEGDVCLLVEDNTPRVRWPLVRIVKAQMGRDGKVRTYTVRFGNRRESTRAAQLRIPLEVTSVV